VSDFLVSPPAETAWQFDADDFEARLRERWPEAEVSDLEDITARALRRFEIPLSGPVELVGHLMADRQVLGLEGTLEDSAAVAEWARSIVPAGQQLIFLDQGYSFHVPLTEGITRDEIVAAALA
jgi:hypothetical protein